MPKPGIEERKPQTKVKHTILEKYLKAWGGIILLGLKGEAQKAKEHGKPFQAHLVYVDCNAYKGRYSGDSDNPPLATTTAPIWGSPIIGIMALDSLHSLAAKCGIQLCTNVILLEETSSNFAELLNSLKIADLSVRVRETMTFADLANGEIAVINGDSVLLGEELVRYTHAGSKFAFYFLDPYGPKGIPLAFVGKIVGQRRHDVMINMPYQDLHKKSGLVSKLDPSDEERKLVRNYDDMFGNTKWHEIVEEMELEGLFDELGWDPTERDGLSVSDKVRQLKTELYVRKLCGIDVDTSPRWQQAKTLELRLINEYKDSLCSSAPELTVKSIGLRFPDKERTIYYLYLTTHDPNGALAMNNVLWDAGYQEHELRWRFKWSQIFAKKGQLRSRKKITCEFWTESNIACNGDTKDGTVLSIAQISFLPCKD